VDGGGCRFLIRSTLVSLEKEIARQSRMFDQTSMCHTL
jgi:hypothetical protein